MRTAKRTYISYESHAALVDEIEHSLQLAIFLEEVGKSSLRCVVGNIPNEQRPTGLFSTLLPVSLVPLSVAFSLPFPFSISVVIVISATSVPKRHPPVVAFTHSHMTSAECETIQATFASISIIIIIIISATATPNHAALFTAQHSADL